MKRDQIIIKTSIIGIIANLALAGFKAAVGLISGSIAIVMDAVNNLSDALSSVITILGTRLAGRKPSKEHPFGHGRIEYLSAIVISVIVLYAGVTSLVESVKKIFDPTLPEYTAPGLLIIAVAVVVKLILGRYVKGVGEKVDSNALKDSGQDAMMDSVISATTLVAAAIYLIFHISVEAWLAAVISILIIKSGLEMAKESISVILGERADAELSLAIKKTVSSFEEVHGTYDLVLNNYGPNMTIGSLHIEVDDTMTADRLDVLEREITQKVIEEHKVIITGISVYARNTKNDAAAQMLNDIRKAVTAHEYVLQIHGFNADMEKRLIRFDVIIDFDAPDAHALYREIQREIAAMYPDYQVEVALDLDVSD